MNGSRSARVLGCDPTDQTNRQWIQDALCPTSSQGLLRNPKRHNHRDDGRGKRNTKYPPHYAGGLTLSRVGGRFYDRWLIAHTERTLDAIRRFTVDTALGSVFAALSRPRP